MHTEDFLPKGKLRIGCNYWASHAGTNTWKDWQPNVIDADFKALSEAGLNLLRVFPLWPDFQPIERLDRYFGEPMEIRSNGAALDDTSLGRAGIDPEMIRRFRELADCALRHDLQLIVGLVTGWMSGRIFAPTALIGKNLITDAEAIRWQGRYVRGMVEALRDLPAIVGWDLGNECNVMGLAGAAESWVWTHTISSAIRKADVQRPIVSGMHSLKADPEDPWAIADQGELTDFLTTHPYPLWTPHCDLEPLTSFRSQLHGTAESRLYADLSGKPCFVEEMGSMGPFIVADQLAPRFLRPALFSLWAHDCRALLWWCAFDQTKLEHPPYDWIPVEQELGIFREDRSPKPHVAVFADFARLLSGLPFSELPPRQIDGICLLSKGQDQWGVALNAFAIAKLAGVDLAFHYGEQTLQHASVYLLPSISGAHFLSRRRWQELLARVKEGATLYVSIDDGLMADLEPWAGARVLTRERCTVKEPVNDLDGNLLFPGVGEFRLEMQITRAVLLATEAGGNPVFTCCQYGSGRIFLLTQPLERAVARVSNAFESGPFSEARQIYEKVFSEALSNRIWKKTSPLLAVTEHSVSDVERLIVLINHSREEIVEPLQLKAGWRAEILGEGIGLNGLNVTVPAGDGAILRLKQ